MTPYDTKKRVRIMLMKLTPALIVLIT